MAELSEKNKRLQEATVKSSEEIKARLDEIVKKEIDPVYKEICGKIEPWLKDSKYLPWALERYMTLEQAKVVDALPDSYREESAGRGIEVSEGFAKKVGLDKKTVDKYMQELYEKGFIFPTRGGPQIPRSVGQWTDTQNNSKFDESLGREFFELVRTWRENERDTVRYERLMAGEPPGMRVVPRWKAIKDVPGVLPVEDVREILKAHQTSLALVHCACKKRYPERECDVPEEVCFVTGRTAEYNIDRGAGKRLNLKEALDFVDEMGKYSVVHAVGYATKTPEDVGLFCHCHVDCCGTLRAGFLPEQKITLEQVEGKSRFVATVDTAKCIGCKTCVEGCQFGGAQMKFYPEYGEERAYVDTERCMGTGCCVENCPVGARGMKTVRPPEDVLERQARREYEAGGVA